MQAQRFGDQVRPQGLDQMQGLWVLRQQEGGEGRQVEAGLRGTWKGQAHLSLLLSAEAAFSADWGVLATPRCSRLSVPFLLQHLLTLCPRISALNSCSVPNAPSLSAYSLPCSVILDVPINTTIH